MATRRPSGEQPLAARRENPVVVEGARLSAADVRKVRRGAPVQVVRAPGVRPSLDFLEPVLDTIEALSVKEFRRVDVSALASMPRLRDLSLDLSKDAHPIDLSGLLDLETLALRTAAAGRMAGSAIQSPRLRDLAIWYPSESLFDTYRSSPASLRLVFLRQLRRLPPISHPESLKSLWIQSVPEFDLSAIGRFSKLEALTIEEVPKGVTGFAALRKLPELRWLRVGNVGSVDKPRTLGKLPLDHFSEWTSPSHEKRIWWMPDLDALAAKGVGLGDPEWLEWRRGYEKRWAERTGKRVPKHF